VSGFTLEYASGFTGIRRQSLGFRLRRFNSPWRRPLRCGCGSAVLQRIQQAIEGGIGQRNLNEFGKPIKSA
jgi:hypothetical protein